MIKIELQILRLILHKSVSVMRYILNVQDTELFCDSCDQEPNYVNDLSFKSNNIQSPKDKVRILKRVVLQHIKRHPIHKKSFT